MSPSRGFTRGDLGTLWTWALAILLATGALVALGVRARVVAADGSLRPAMDETRALLIAVFVVAALVARRRASRAEAIGFALMAGALMVSVAIDAAMYAARPTVDAVGAVSIQPAVERWALLWRLATLVASFLLPAFLGASLLGVQPLDLLQPPEPVGRPIAVAALAGLLLWPTVAWFHAYASASVATAASWWNDAVVATPGFVPLEAATRTSLLVDQVQDPFAIVALLVGLQLPALELLLHGTLRQSFNRWGIVPCVVGTAVLAPVLVMSAGLTFGLFPACLATGLLAARSGSVVPGFVFWQALYIGRIGWIELLTR